MKKTRLTVHWPNRAAVLLAAWAVDVAAANLVCMPWTMAPAPNAQHHGFDCENSTKIWFYLSNFWQILVNVLSNDSCFYFFLVGCFWNLSTKSVEWFPVPVSSSFWYNAVIIFSWGLWQWLILMKMIGPDGNRLRFFVRRRGRDTYLLRPGSGLCAFTTMALMIKKLWTFKGEKTKKNQRNWNRTYTYYTYTHFPPKIYLSHLSIVFTVENAFCKNQKNDQSGSGIWEKTSEERR